MKKLRIFIIGSSGFICRNVVERFLASNMKNKSNDNSIPPLTEWIKQISRRVHAIHREDQNKYKRLNLLSKITNFQVNGPVDVIKTEVVLNKKYKNYTIQMLQYKLNIKQTTS